VPFAVVVHGIADRGHVESQAIHAGSRMPKAVECDSRGWGTVASRAMQQRGCISVGSSRAIPLARRAASTYRPRAHANAGNRAYQLELRAEPAWYDQGHT